ncbi:hypothetical protein E3N88_37717 [Mikania micrantha]|uniref:Uncharacterized protein n=1 Tax=Mikania micrantha TaxID=192012 RepID=A0A5N6LS48_9ASTR|nr:hypothetical protein E3N88_37717 [Mikania micrantha]
MSVTIFATVTIYERPSNDLKPAIARFLHSLLKCELQLFHKLDIKLLVERKVAKHLPYYYSSKHNIIYNSGEESSLDNETGGSDTFAESPAEYLHYIAFKCGTKSKAYFGVDYIRDADSEDDGEEDEDDSAHADVDPQSISTSFGGEVLQALAYDIQIPVYKTKNTIPYLSEHEDIQMEVERRSRQELEEEIRKERQERHELQQQMKEFMKKFMQRPNS